MDKETFNELSEFYKEHSEPNLDEFIKFISLSFDSDKKGIVIPYNVATETNYYPTEIKFSRNINIDLLMKVFHNPLFDRSIKTTVRDNKTIFLFGIAASMFDEELITINNILEKYNYILQCDLIYIYEPIPRDKLELWISSKYE